MNVIDEILNEWSYRCHDGIVDMNDPEKKSILDKILEEYNIDKNNIISESDETYDQIIKKYLKVEEIPQVQNTYDLGKDVNINGEDAKIFKTLYPIAPPKKNQDIEAAGSKGVGHGELALYWLFAHQPGKSALVNPGRGKADLIIDGNGVEVKAYDSKNMALGRIGSDKDNIELLNTLFGLYSLVSTIDNTSKDKKASSLNFSEKDLVSAFNTVKDFTSNDTLKELTTKYPLISSIYTKIDNLLNKLPEGTNIDDVEDAAGALMKLILVKKINEKIGTEGYIVNVNDNGNLKYFKINKDIIDNIPNKNILKNTSINQGSLIINPENLFSK